MGVWRQLLVSSRSQSVCAECHPHSRAVLPSIQAVASPSASTILLARTTVCPRIGVRHQNEENPGIGGERHSRAPSHGVDRRLRLPAGICCGDVFYLASAVLKQSPIQSVSHRCQSVAWTDAIHWRTIAWIAASCAFTSCTPAKFTSARSLASHLSSPCGSSIWNDGVSRTFAPR